MAGSSGTGDKASQAGEAPKVGGISMVDKLREKKKKQLHEQLDLENLNKNITIRSEVFDVHHDKEERVKFMEDIIKLVIDQVR